MNPRYVLAPLFLAAFASVAVAQCSVSTDPVSTTSEKYPTTPLTYPMMSDRYAVQYSVSGGAWTNGKVYISYYGGTNASPWRRDSGYALPYQLPASSTSPVRPDWETSMSFVSIPAGVNTQVRLRVAKLFGRSFDARDHVSVRPSVKRIDVDPAHDGTVEISIRTDDDFAGEQFILWWDRGAEGGGIEALAVFLNPPYQPPPGNVKTITSWNDLNGADLSTFDALDFEGPDPIALGGTGMQAFTVPANIKYVFLGPDAWVQGKLRFNPHLEPFAAFQADPTRWLYGPGVLDVSRFRYDRRVCGSSSDFPDEGLYALTSTGNPLIEHLNIDGIIITDHNHAAAEALSDSIVNNVKTLGWNGENAALRLQDHTTVSNVFVRSGDDSLMMWGSPVSVKNATVWQNYNGGVVNLGWSDNSPGDHNLLDGLYVVKTDWQIPTDPSWIALDPASHPLQGQNNAVFASLMSPGTNFGKAQRPVFRNIFVEDRPQVLFSLKIIPPICSPSFLVCRPVTLTKDSVVNLNIENLFTPASIVENSIGFQILPAGYPITLPDGSTMTLPADYTLTGSMNIGLTNVWVTLPDGRVKALTSANADAVGKLETNGDNVNLDIDRHDQRRRDWDGH
jgi:hypothetical protein